MLLVEALVLAAEIVAAAKCMVTLQLTQAKQPKALSTGKDMAETAYVYCMPAVASDTMCQKQTFAA